MAEVPVVLIAGATGGLGRCVSLAFARRGYALTLVGRDLDKLKGLMHMLDAELGKSDVLARQIDFVRVHESEVEAVFADTVERFGGLHYLVNCVGTGGWWSIHRLPWEVWQTAVAVNLTSAFVLSKHAVSPMVRSGGGTLVHIVSPAASRGSAYATAYCATKAGLMGFCQALACELHPRGVRVVAVMPGPIATGFIERAISDSDPSLAEYTHKYGDAKAASPETMTRRIMATLDQAAPTTSAQLVVCNAR